MLPHSVRYNDEPGAKSKRPNAVTLYFQLNLMVQATQCIHFYPLFLSLYRTQLVAYLYMPPLFVRYIGESGSKSKYAKQLPRVFC